MRLLAPLLLVLAISSLVGAAVSARTAQPPAHSLGLLVVDERRGDAHARVRQALLLQLVVVQRVERRRLRLVRRRVLQVRR